LAKNGDLDLAVDKWTAQRVPVIERASPLILQK